MRTLIGIAGCHKNKAKADAQRATWVRDVRGVDVRFFAGGRGIYARPDDVWLDCSDAYEDRKEKVLAMFRWALDHGYDYLWKTDDDCYVRPERLLAIPRHDYCGLVILWGNELPGPSYFQMFASMTCRPAHICHGVLYGLSRSSMEKLLTADTLPHIGNGNGYEDVWVGLRLKQFGVLPVTLGVTDERPSLIRCTHIKGVANNWPNQEAPSPRNEVVASYEHSPEQMLAIHQAFRQ